jgi:hypothetical protein
MTFKIAKSVIDGMGIDYAAEVEAFRQAKLAHRFTGDIAPSAPAIIEHAVRRVPVEGQADDFVTDYEVVDDTPPPPSLNERKGRLLDSIRAAEFMSLGNIISPARERLMGMDINHVYGLPEGDRDDRDREALATWATIAKRKQAVQRHAALLEIEVEDLTEADIEAWVPKPFPA